MTTKTIKTLLFSPIPFMLGAFLFVFYLIANTYNPDSWFCAYKIYKQTDGIYQVWWVSRTSTCELSGATYQQAKDFQIKSCKSHLEFMSREPKGERQK